jgi:hypothetical protein
MHVHGPQKKPFGLSHKGFNWLARCIALGELWSALCANMSALCANMSETSSPSTITVGRGKKSHFDNDGQDKYFRCVGSFGA